jgi:hypothetical protein
MSMKQIIRTKILGTCIKTWIQERLSTENIPCKRWEWQSNADFHMFWIGEKSISVSILMYMELTMVGMLKYIHLILVLLKFKLILKSWEVTDHLVQMKFWLNWSSQEVQHYIPRSTMLLFPFEIRKNCQCCGKNPLLYLFIKKAVKRCSDSCSACCKNQSNQIF